MRFNCTSTQHRPLECNIKRTCQMYERKHHTTIFDKSRNMILPQEKLVFHTVFVTKVSNVICRVLLLVHDVVATLVYGSLLVAM